MRRRWLSHALTVACCGLLWAGYTWWSQPSERGNHWGTSREVVGLIDDPSVAVHVRCRIAHPGSAPWDKHNAQGDEWKAATRIALLQMGLPPDHADVALHKISAGAIDDIVTMGADSGIATHSRQAYRPTFSTTAMKDGRRLVCHDSRYTTRESQSAALYRVGDFHVAVFTACGNVSRLLPMPDRPEVSVPRIEQGPGEVAPIVRELPEPSSVWLVGIGIFALVAARRKR